MKLSPKILAVAALVASTSAASAASINYATGYLDAVRGTINPSPVSDADRDDPMDATGAPDGIFYSLGLGGSIIMTFGQTFNSSAGQEVKAYEVTFGDVSGYPESVDVYASLGGVVGDFIGSISNVDAQSGATLSYAGMFDGLYFEDTTPGDSPSFDGFDLDAVGVSAVPLPAAGLMLIAGVAGLGALRRRKKS